MISTLDETFQNALCKMLEERIRDSVKEIEAKALKDIKGEIDRWVAAVAIEVFKICTFERDGLELRIVVDTSKLKMGEK